MLETLTSNPLSSTSYGALALAIVSLWAHSSRRLWMGFAILALGAGFAAGRIDGLGILWLVLVGGCFFVAQQPHRPRSLRWLTGGLALAGAGALTMHLLPGFDNWRLVDRLSLSEASRPFSLYLNLDKPFLGLLILGFGFPLVRSFPAWRRLAWGTIPYFITAVAVLLGLVAILGYVGWDPKLPELFWLWAPRNLLFACVAEEALFRGFLQRQLSVALGAFRWGGGASVVVAALLFGLAHFRGGPSYVVLSTVAGFIYGLAYYRTGRLEAAIGCHFAVNTVHFLLFTYPALAT
ncbi:MAG: CPBP family intramembrane metalloprotease [Deltaproteobacteria bacterium]|nr:CPBP family intramembrane metalloprotease [Deltaproteobacteria bacterium]